MKLILIRGKAQSWDERLHPRDGHGRFSREFSSVERLPLPNEASQGLNRAFRDVISSEVTSSPTDEMIFEQVAKNIAPLWDVSEADLEELGREEYDNRWSFVDEDETKRSILRLTLAKDAVNGHHVPGTPYNWRHGWEPLNAQTAQAHGMPWNGKKPSREKPSGGKPSDGKPAAKKEHTPEETAAIKAYMTTRYKEINGPLRDKKQSHKPEDAESVKHLDAVFARTRTTEEMKVFRGTYVQELYHRKPDGKIDWSKPPDIWPPEDSIGSVIEDMGFASTSHRRGASESFGDVLFEITVPKGSPALDLRGHDYGLQEQETLLQRGSRFRITSERQEGTKRVLVLEYLPPEESESKGIVGPEFKAAKRTQKVTAEERLCWGPSMVKIIPPSKPSKKTKAENKQAGARRIEMKRRAFNESQVVRDGDGQFADKPGGSKSPKSSTFKAGDKVSLGDGSSAEVVAMIGDDRVAVLHPDGKRAIVPLSEVAPEKPKENDESPKSSTFKAGDKVSLEDGSPAEVVAMIGDDRVAVLRPDGKRSIVPLAEVGPEKAKGDDKPKATEFDPEDYFALPDPVITDAEEQAVMFYRGNGYQEMNRQLRENEGDLDDVDDPAIKKHIQNVDRAIKKNKLDRDLTVWRGISKSYARDLVPDAEVDVLAFSSTSLSRGKAEEFADGGVLMSIELPKGTPALKAFDGDFEILLPRGIVLVVDRVEDGVVYVRPE